MSKSNIEWTESTWNPIVGCSIVSPGCTNCYAMKMAARTEAMGISRYDGTTSTVNGYAVWTGKLARAPEATLLQPLKRKKPTTYFVNSMGDLFHEDVPDEWIDQVFAVMALCRQHTFQVLTKRAARMLDYLVSRNGMGNAAICKAINGIPASLGNRRGALEMPLRNVWLGVSTERQHEADERIPLLLNTPAAVRFISAEPLLGPIHLSSINHRGVVGGHGAIHDHGLGKLDWVIAGGESGPRARPIHPDWARSLRDQCAEAEVPFFFKQWGNWKPLDQMQEKIIRGAGKHAVVRLDGGHTVDTDVADPPRDVFTFNMGKKGAGRILDGALHDAMPAHES